MAKENLDLIEKMAKLEEELVNVKSRERNPA